MSLLDRNSAYLLLLQSGGSAPVDEPDFTIEYVAFETSWGTELVAYLVPNAAAIAAGAYFVLPDEDAGLAVVNG